MEIKPATAAVKIPVTRMNAAFDQYLLSTTAWQQLHRYKLALYENSCGSAFHQGTILDFEFHFLRFFLQQGHEKSAMKSLSLIIKAVSRIR
jgi:hypothetical protein